MSKQYVRNEVYELLVIMRGRTMAPRGWHLIQGGLEGRSQMTPAGLMLVIATPSLEEARRLLHDICEQSWADEILWPRIEKRIVVSTWVPVPADEWQQDYFEQAPGAIDQPFLQSVGVLPSPSRKELPPASGILGSRERDLNPEERRRRFKHREREHLALTSSEQLRREAEEQLAYEERAREYERQAAEERAARAEEEERKQRESEKEARKQPVRPLSLLDFAPRPDGPDQTDQDADQDRA